MSTKTHKPPQCGIDTLHRRLRVVNRLIRSLEEYQRMRNLRVDAKRAHRAGGRASANL